MKGIFRKGTRNGSMSSEQTSNDSDLSSRGIGSSSSQPTKKSNKLTDRLTSVLGPQFSVPPFPNPSPHRSLAIQCTSNGLLILPIANPILSHKGEKTPETTDDLRSEDVAYDKILSKIDASKQGAAGGVDLTASSAIISWNRDATINTLTPSDSKHIARTVNVEKENCRMHCYGVIGILRVFKGAYLFVITSRTFAGDYLSSKRPVYRCSGVLAIPLDYQSASHTVQKEAQRQWDAHRSMEQGLSGKKVASSGSEAEDDSEDEVSTPSVIDKDAFKLPALEKNGIHLSSSATVKLTKSDAWHYSKSTRSASENGQKEESQSFKSRFEPQVNNQTVDAPQNGQQEYNSRGDSQVSHQNELTSDQRWHEATKAELEEKVVKETARQYSRGEMWFAYDFDLTTPQQRKQDALESMAKGNKAEQRKINSASQHNSSSMKGLDPNAEPWPTLPLWRRVDRRFWHNENLSKDFVEAGLHGLVLPLMQGYFQVTHLPIDTPSPPMRTLDLSGDAMDAVSEVVNHTRLYAQLLVISRRSKERAGLRYQRRGVNSQGQVANYVESEQILFIRRGDEEAHVMSFVQFRGSIPLYWSQDPFSMKPPPLLEGSAEDNKKAFAKHFDSQLQKYNKVICINLAEQHGKEGQITKAYHDASQEFSNDKVVYKAFDFHEECKGMKFERVGKLIDDMREGELKQMDCFWKCVKAEKNEKVIYSKQQGAFRVSCLDCLDRTNVVQSAFARHMLGVQLERLGVHVANGQGERDEAFDFAFNDSWANNGDMISQIYAGTRALKGDFTRTGKRNFIGMMNDATNSVYRMMQGAVTDFFKQTVIDFQYGFSTLATLERYNDDLIAPDPSQSNRLARARAHAIEMTARELIPSSENLLAGWTLFSPIEPNRIETPKLEEKVVLLTNKALYSCGYDFTAEKIAEFSKIKMGDILSIKKGAYILSPNEGYHPENHWGLIVSYISEERRMNTSSIRNKPTNDPISPSAINFIAFRAVVDDASLATLQGLDGSIKAAPQFAAHLRNSAGGLNTNLTSHDVVDAIVSVLVDQCATAGACDLDDLSEFVKDETIQSLTQAKANASLFAPLIEGLKRRVWL